MDGSLQDGAWSDFRATGFGIVVVSETEELVAYGHGCPPQWCRTAAAAEGWALLMALSLNPFPPNMRTDCLGLLQIAEGGIARATAADRPMARLWSQIGIALDGDVSVLMSQGCLVWMPAHLSAAAAVGHASLSNGAKMSMVDWRANRLVDALAKQAAAGRRAPMAIRRLLESGRVAAKHAAKLLGRVTHAANNCELEMKMPDGTRVLKKCRDAQQHTRHQCSAARTRCRKEPAPPAALPGDEATAGAAAIGACGAWPPGHLQMRKRAADSVDVQASRRAKVARLAMAREKATDDARTLQRIAEIGARLFAPVSRLPADERMQRLRERVRARSSQSVGSGSAR